MTRGLAFWIITLIWLTISLMAWSGYGSLYMLRANGVLEFLLFGLLGWQVFGTPVK